jgi:hypothetical protein
MYGVAEHIEDEFELMNVRAAREEGLVEHQFSQSAAETPDIYALVVVPRSVDDLWRPVVPRGDVAGLLLRLLSVCRLQRPGDAEVAHFSSPVLHKVDVAWLDISVHKPPLVDMMQPLDDLLHDAPQLLEGQGDFLVPSEVHEGGAQVQNQVVPFLVAFVLLNQLPDAHHVGVIQTSHHLQLWVIFDLQHALPHALLSHIGLQLLGRKVSDCLTASSPLFFFLVYRGDHLVAHILVLTGRDRLLLAHRMDAFDEIDLPEGTLAELGERPVVVDELGVGELSRGHDIFE